MFYNMLRATVSDFHFFDHETGALWPQTTRIRAQNLVTKRPLDVMQAEEILNQLSGVRIIVCIRDPRALLVSVHQEVPDDYFIDWDHQYFVPRQGRPAKRNPGIMPIFRQIKKIQGSVTILRYEDLVTNTAEIQARLGEIIPFRYNGQFQDFHRRNIPAPLRNQLNGVRRVDSSRLAAWRDHSDRICQQFNECPELFDVLLHFGYESDREWFHSLP